jgi:Exocyst complex subunit Sec15 C-terminal
MSVETIAELEQLRNITLKPLESNPTPFPHTLPFSHLYPRCCTCIRHFVNEYYMFSFESVQSQYDVDEILRKVGLLALSLLTSPVIR